MTKIIKLTVYEKSLLRILKLLTEHAKEKYPHFESERGQAQIRLAEKLISKSEVY